ncbi:MAG: ribose 5-phosphate isomerase B [Chloroflexi bacterium]|nr:ribose 5-phosphate isomerase B [Chloroflexota bacterium]
MTQLSESDIRAIVERVVKRTLGGADSAAPAAAPPQPVAARGDDNNVALGADHGGYPLKEILKTHLASLNYNVIDCGTNSTDAVDYPDFAYAVARLVSEGKAWRGIVIDGAGIGSAMVANKVPRVRAALCYDHATAMNSREHNDANVLTLGAGLIGANLAKQIVEVWLKTEFGGGRHAKRVEKIIEVEKRFLKE